MHGAVEQVERISPAMVRVVLGGDGLDGFEMVPFTDAYVNLLFVPPRAPYAVPFDLAQARALDRDAWPVPRRFSVRAWDEATRRLTIDVVVHGDEGTAGRWAQRARPGDLLQLAGPSGAYRPDPAAAWHLLVGDESALPAIAASVEVLAPDAEAVVVLLVDGPDHEVALGGPVGVDVVWLHRETLAGTAEEALVAAVAAITRPFDGVRAFVHGEAVETRAVRRHLLGERAVPRDALSVSPYWRRTMTDERWREVKRDWLAEVERDT